MLSEAQRRFVEAARRAVLATESPDGRPRPVPVCFALLPVDTTGDERLYIPIDEKPKRSLDPGRLARVRDILARPRVALLFDRWDEDWSKLAWLRIDGTASLLRAARHDAGTGTDAQALAGRDDELTGERQSVIRLLRGRYPQYASQVLEARPLIRIAVTRAVEWTAQDGLQP